MASSETLAIVDSEELRIFKGKIDLQVNELIDSFEEMYKQYEDVAGNGWEDDNQQSFEDEISEVKQELISKITEFKEVAVIFLDKKINIIEEYCKFDMSL